MAFCSNCGSQMGNDAAFCPQCGAKVGESNSYQAPPTQNSYSGSQYTSQQYTPPSYQNQPYKAYQGNQIDTQPYFIWSLLNTILCCMPLGIAGLVYVNKIKSAASQEEATKMMGTVKTLCLIGTIAGFVATVFIFFISILSEM